MGKEMILDPYVGTFATAKTQVLLPKQCRLIGSEVDRFRFV